MKIAYILPRFPRISETFILREMNAIRSHAVTVEIFSLLPSGKGPVHAAALEWIPRTHYGPFLLSREMFAAHVHFLLRFPSRYARAFVQAVRQSLHEPRVLIRVLLFFPKSVLFARRMEQLGVDHVHAHFVWVNGIAASVAYELTGISFSLHPHAFGIFRRNPIDVCRQLQRAVRVITISGYHVKTLSQICPHLTPGKIEIVRLGLDPGRFRASGAPSREGPPCILSVGNLVPKKGHDVLLEACALLTQERHWFQCVIVGSGPLEATLRKRIRRSTYLRDRVHLLGARTEDEVLKLYRSCQVFALPCMVARDKNRDGMPNVLIEAMAMELPVVTTPVSAIPELVTNGLDGLIVPQGDARALANALERLLRDKSLRRKLGKNAREKVLACHDIHQTSAKLTAVFSRIIEEDGLAKGRDWYALGARTPGKTCQDVAKIQEKKMGRSG